MTNATDHGFVGDGATLHTGDQLRELIEFALTQRANASGVALYFPSGTYRITGTAQIARGTYEFYRLRIVGDGKSQSVIHKIDHTDLLHFTNSGGYTAELSLQGMGFFGGKSILRAENLYYSQVADCGFRGTGGWDGDYALHLDGNTGKVLIDNIWAYHGGDVLHVANGYVTLSNSQIGEDVGEVFVNGELRAVNVRWDADVFNRKSRTMGPAAVTVANRSRAHFVGCSAHVGAGRAWINVTSGEHVAVDGCHFVLWGGSIIRNHGMGNRRGVAINGGMVQVRTPSLLWARHANTPPSNSSITNMRITLDDFDTCEIDDAFFDPSKRNVYENNLVTWKV